MRTLMALCLAALACAGTARANDLELCSIPSHLVFDDKDLPHVAAAVEKTRRLDILIIGTASSGPARNAAFQTYPARLEDALKRRLKGVAIKIVVQAQPRQTTAMLAKQLKGWLAADKPSLVIWQTGTVDAIRQIAPAEFNAALDAGLLAIHLAGADAILMNMQYSPRTEIVFDVDPYADNMRWVSQQHSVPLFDRLSIMQHWSDVGTFDLSRSSRDLKTAKAVHDCLGRALAAMIIEGADLQPYETGTPK